MLTFLPLHVPNMINQHVNIERGFGLVTHNSPREIDAKVVASGLWPSTQTVVLEPSTACCAVPVEATGSFAVAKVRCYRVPASWRQDASVPLERGQRQSETKFPS